jgi:hypothetical protein
MSTEQNIISRVSSILSARGQVSGYFALPGGKKRKLMILKSRLAVQKIEQVGVTHYRVTVTNTGNGSAYSGRCDLFAGVNSSITLRQTLNIVLHPGQTRTLDFLNYRPTAGESVHAFLYDPISDPFPVFFAPAFAMNSRNLVKNGTNPAHGVPIPATWKQSDKISGTFTAVSEANKTWEGRNKDTADPDTRLSSYFKPLATVASESQLVQEISMISPAFDARVIAEINKGNFTWTASVLLRVYNHSPVDEASFLVQLTGGALRETGYRKDLNWQLYTLSDVVPQNPGKATITLRSKRNFGTNNDGFFANIEFRMKHRQIASIHKSLTQQ